MEDEAVDFADDTEISKEDEGNILYLMIELEQALMRVGPEWTATQAKAVTRSAAAYSYADIYAALPVGGTYASHYGAPYYNCSGTWFPPTMERTACTTVSSPRREVRASQTGLRIAFMSPRRI